LIEQVRREKVTGFDEEYLMLPLGRKKATWDFEKLR
jgi:hypothetical protein